MVAVASAQSYGSFSEADLEGLTVMTPVMGDNKKFEIGLNAGATIQIGMNVYPITEFWGFWVMRTPGGVSDIGTGVDDGDWKFSKKTQAAGDIAGWQVSGAASRLTAGQTKVLTYTTLDVAGIEEYGYHVTYTGPNNTPVTAYFKDVEAVPEPATFVLGSLGLMAATQLRKRRQRQ